MSLSITNKNRVCRSFGNSACVNPDNIVNNKSSVSNKNAENPISKKGEKVVLFSGALISAMGVILKGLYKISSEDTDGSLNKSFNKFINKIIDKKSPNVKGEKRDVMFIGTSLLVLGLIVIGGGILNVITKAPKLNYEGNINAFKKSKEMDAYIKGNNAEVELYNQMNERAKSTFDPQERQKLYSSYMLLQNAKNIPPNWAS